MHVLVVVEAVLANIIVLASVAVIARANDWLGLAQVADVVLVDCDHVHVVDFIDQFLFAAPL